LTSVLVSGGAGFIGSRVTAELPRRGRVVCVLDDFSTRKRENLAAVGGDVELIVGDVRSSGRVIHLAAVPSAPRSLQIEYLAALPGGVRGGLADMSNATATLGHTQSAGAAMGWADCISSLGQGQTSPAARGEAL